MSDYVAFPVMAYFDHEDTHLVRLFSSRKYAVEFATELYQAVQALPELPLNWPATLTADQEAACAAHGVFYARFGFDPHNKDSVGVEILEVPLDDANWRSRPRPVDLRYWWNGTPVVCQTLLDYVRAKVDPAIITRAVGVAVAQGFVTVAELPDAVRPYLPDSVTVDV